MNDNKDFYIFMRNQRHKNQTKNTAGYTLFLGENFQQYLSKLLTYRSANIRFLFMHLLQYTSVYIS